MMICVWYIVVICFLGFVVSHEGRGRQLQKCSSCFCMLVTMGKKILVNVSDVTHVKAL